MMSAREISIDDRGAAFWGTVNRNLFQPSDLPSVRRKLRK